MQDELINLDQLEALSMGQIHALAYTLGHDAYHAGQSADELSGLVRASLEGTTATPGTFDAQLYERLAAEAYASEAYKNRKN